MTEKQLTLKLTIWFRNKYPNTPYRVDIAADMPLPPIHRGRLKVLHGKWSRGHCDLVIYATTKKYSGLHIELKANKVILNEHTRRQTSYHEVLRENGYKAEFSCGYDATVDLINKYMKKVKVFT